MNTAVRRGTPGGTARRRRRAARQHPARRRKFLDYPRGGKRGLRRWLPSWRQLLGALVAGLAVLVTLVAAVYASVDIPDGNAAARQEANVYYWADGSQMVSVGAVNRQNVPLSQVPHAVQNAVIAAENASFYSDSGVSFTGLARAAVNMARGQDTQGGSTITQQYVKNTYLSQDQTLTRKLREFCIALKVDKQQTKQQILQGYLNTSWFGRGAYGIQAAAVAYYGVDAADLNPSQGALLAALLKGAEGYDPSLGPANRARAEERWNWILDREVEVGLMPSAERAGYRDFPEPRKPSTSNDLGGQIGYLVDAANKYVKKRTGLTARDLDRGGYRIHTTFEKDKVDRLERAVKGVLARNIDPKHRAADRHVEVGAASVRPEDGAIVALYGGADATKHFTNNADTSGVPVGSAFKPFVLAAALQAGARSSAADGPLPVAPDGNYDRSGRLQTTIPLLKRTALWGVPLLFPALQDAVATSANAPFVQLGGEVGLKRVRDMAVASGLLEGSMARLERTFPIGTSTPSAIRMADAYGTFANDGLQTDPYSVTTVVKDGKRIGGLGRQPARRAMDRGVAERVTSILRDAPLSGAAAKEVGRFTLYSAGSTGEDDRMKSAWFVGYTEDLSTAVTMFRTKPGQPQLLPMHGVGGEYSMRGSVFPPEIWSEYAAANLPWAERHPAS